MKYNRFEDLPIWQDARHLTKKIYIISKDGEFAKDYRFRSQICSSSVSVMSNIAEGFEYGSNPQFIRFLNIASGSCGELRSQLYVSFDVGYIDEKTLNDLKTKAESLSKQMAKLISYLEKYNNNNTTREPQTLETILWNYFNDAY